MLGYLKELLNPGTSPRVPSETPSRISSGNQKDAPFYTPHGASPKILSDLRLRVIKFSTFDFCLWYMRAIVEEIMTSLVNGIGKNVAPIMVTFFLPIDIRIGITSLETHL